MGEVAKIRGLYRPKTKIWLTEGKLIFRKLINVTPRLLGTEEYQELHFNDLFGG